MTPALVLEHIAQFRKVAVKVSSLAAGLGIAEKDRAGHAELERNLAVLLDAQDICRWTIKGKPTVTLSSLSAYRMRLRLNTSSTRWIEHGTADEPDRNRPRTTTTASGATAKIMCESDMSEEPPGMLANVIDTRTEIDGDPDFGRARILAEEARLGLKRPTLPLVGVKPWTAGNWERAPDAHVCDPLDDPRRVADPGDGKAGKGKRRLTPEKLRAIRPATGDCPVCQGRDLREMTSLAPMKIGKNRATRSPEVVDGGEFCCKCSRSYQDSIWPRVFRLPEDAKGETTGETP